MNEFREFGEFLKKITGKKLLILTHSGADVDAIASAAALYLSLRKKCPSYIGVPEHLNINAKALAENMEIPYIKNPLLKDFDALICVDFNSAEMAGKLSGELKEFRKPIFVLDHHAPAKQGITSKENSIIKEEAISTTELVHDLLVAEKIPVTPQIASLIACGIITDSSSFLVADHETFKIMAEVMEKSQRNYPELLSLFKAKQDLSERIASLKSAKRASFFKTKNFIFAASEVGAFEATAANVLVRIGADAAFCGAVENGMVRVSGRASNRFLKATGLDLARDVFIPLSKNFEGDGGGHPGAAAFNGKAKDIESVLKKCVELLYNALPKKDVEGSLKEVSG
ncbi:MAG: DHH family phosphoesterase [Candidatus Diapherotrites archaeon]